jgi:hypothetical protein
MGYPAKSLREFVNQNRKWILKKKLIKKR